MQLGLFSFDSAFRTASARAVCRGVAAALLLAAVLTTGARAEGPYLTLFETIVDPNVWPAGQYDLSDGAVLIDLNSGSYKVQHRWSRPPAQFDAAGFDVTLGAAGQVSSNCQPLYAGTGASGGAFEFDHDPAGTDVNLVPPPNCDLNAGASGNSSLVVHVTPRGTLSAGDVLEFRVGAYFGPGVTYRYRVSDQGTTTGGGGGKGGVGGPGDDARLAGSLECDASTIVISALPSLNCHIVLTSWRRNTATPVEVSFPNELDTFGNHPNGIQLSGRGSEDVFNWEAPHRWGLFVFACPGQPGAGTNCYGAVTPPGPVEVNVLVRQGDDTLPLRLILTAVGQTRPTGFTLSTGGTSAFIVEPDTDRPGLDYRSFDVTVDDPQACLDACAAEAMCVAFTHVRPGIQGPNARCWLKSAVPAGGPSPCCVSGVRQ